MSDKLKPNKYGMTPVHVAQSDFMEAMAEEGLIDSELCLKPENAKYIQKLLDKMCNKVRDAYAQPEAVTNKGDVAMLVKQIFYESCMWEKREIHEAHAVKLIADYTVTAQADLAKAKKQRDFQCQRTTELSLEVAKARDELYAKSVQLNEAREVIEGLEAKFGPMLKEIEARGYRNDFAPQYVALTTARTWLAANPKMGG